MPLLLGIIATFLTTFVAIHSARHDKFPRKYLLMLAGAGTFTMVGAAWSTAEQRTFEKFVLGGDSYVYVTFEALDNENSKFNVRHDGGLYPAYDAMLDLYDMRKFVGVLTGDPREFQKRMQSIQRDAFGPLMTVSWPNQFNPPDCYGYWVAMTYLRNRPVMSVINARKINGTWESATRVVTMDEKQTLLREEATPGWDLTIIWPTVKMNSPGNFNFVAPTITCS